MNCRWARVFAAVLGIMALASAASAQRAFRAAPPEAAKVRTKDGVDLSITYYASRLKKDATPVVMLHDEKDTQGMFSSLALRLQSPAQDEDHPSFAVLTVDLRGHGGSTRQTAPNGATRDLDAAKLSRADIVAMVEDTEAVRRFLVEKNDAGDLNLNKLCLVGAGLGATVAVNWAATDWTQPPLLVGKQGQDVKALVLISPRWKFRGVGLQQAIAVPGLKQDVAWMMIFGEQGRGEATDVKKIYRLLDRFHPVPESAQDPPRNLAVMPFPSSLQGGKLVSQVGEPIENAIIDFLTVHVADKEFQWSKRRDPLQ
jgi:pimeloyl-ACP methyl ester carboxylesterase